ncbi:hypothetical protein BNJ_00457 [Kaumoebavirus]|uniref:hypothetical protein n=1 Tax=Kaumoebavirus TaxID=1859492 RepID=UPI0009C3485F|nr:hypothetical protein BNJ_00457 [Kaumoebavirus]ARA72269.1 hypothetical protein BNJ_00457 [Kaumoebavirus]
MLLNELWVPKEIWLDIFDKSPTAYGRMCCASKEMRRVLPKFEAVRRWTKGGLLPNGKKNGIIYEEVERGGYVFNEEQFWLGGEMISSKIVYLGYGKVEQAYKARGKDYNREGPCYSMNLESNGVILFASSQGVRAMIWKDSKSGIHYKEEEVRGLFQLRYCRGDDPWTFIGESQRPVFWNICNS